MRALRDALPALLVAVCIFGTDTVRAQTVAPPDHSLAIGFDRFFSKEGVDNTRAGRLLLGELHCTSCHQAPRGAELQASQAPVLDGVGGRVRAEFLRAFLSDPQATKPGTTMPNLLAALPESERKQSVEALVHFLVGTSTLIDVRPTPKWIGKGKKLYHEVGCAACHGPREGQLKEQATVLPLGMVSKKYSIISLTNFLYDPHKTRPSGRMPNLHLSGSEAQAIAHYLLADLALPEPGANANYAYYELDAEPERLPDLARLKPAATGETVGFDLANAPRTSNVAMKFDGVLIIPKEGDYTLHVTSDDGSRLWLGNRLVVDNDGVHAPVAKSGKVHLPKGTTPITVAVFNAGGGFELEVTIEGPGLVAQPLSHFLKPSHEAARSKSTQTPPETFIANPELARRGRELFATLGCALCHNLKDGQNNIVSSWKPPELTKLKPGAGCLADAGGPRTKAPRYSLTARQRTALNSTLEALANEPVRALTPKETIVQTFTAFNCYACHQRDGIGGVQPGLNDFFSATQKEMGDEGRLPPHLNGVGGKLRADYLKKVLANGATDRPYMLTRMPKFGDSNVGHLQAALEAADPVPAAPLPTFKVDGKKIKSEGRNMVGNRVFGCIKCHNFREYKSGGVQGINMTIMTDRLRREWFTQYLMDPNKFRPGTRMPAVWPLGQSQLPKVLEGDTAQQIEAVWRYLSDGTKAALPYGVGRELMPLIAQDTPIIYRNFIQGAGTRAIGVGYPEKINLAFDANDLRYALIWHKEFIDASRHWTDRGSGFQPPLGEGVLALATGPTIAILKNKDETWPAKAQKDKGYHFRGYRFDDKLRPTFLYDLGAVHVADFMLPVEDKDSEHFQRTVILTAEAVPADLWFRAASGSEIKDVGGGWYTVGNDLKIRLEITVPAVVRTIVGKMELLVPIRGKDTKIVEEIWW
jgi:mono/diheme cytochrome c family protein/cytochrome c2